MSDHERFRTKAGQSLWDAIATKERLSTNGERMDTYRRAILSVEFVAYDMGWDDGYYAGREAASDD